MAEVLKRVEAKVIERVQNYDFVTTTLDTY